MKKFINKHWLLMLLLVACMSCDGILDDKGPLDSRNEEVFYKTEDDALEALISVYDVLQLNTVIGYHPYQMLLDIASDDAYAGGASSSDAPNIIEIDKFDISTTNGEVYGLYKKYYTGIYRANKLLAEIDGIEEGDAATLARMKAEAKFLRAYFYFDLVRFFENVPLILQPLSPNEYNQPQADPSDIYNQIATDLMEAITDLPQERQADGRISVWAAKSLLPRVYLFYHGFYGGDLKVGDKTYNGTSAMNMIDDVIEKSGHELVSDYASLFTLAGEMSIESVFEIQYSNLVVSCDYSYIQGCEGNIGIQMQGPRVQDPAGEKYAAGWSFCTVTQDLYDAYETGDPRRDASILTMSEFNGDLTIGFQHTGMFNQKYTTKKEFQSDKGEPALNWGNNYHAIRFSDVLLMGAELHATNGGGRAQEYLDRVRDRVSMPSVTANLPNIYHERRVELALEGHRYWDVLRRGPAVAASELTLTNQSGPDFEDGEPEDYEVQFKPQTKGFLPIPQVERDLLGETLSQNEGY
ncbi:RagB/SusD family nutrient uptake outer membrane protein [Fulvivirga sediminis]|uniref:RagB/SusD family nutrient uptake outer membrane protein n=1 Tax=Fulvivirga sediminis TaxID=2803949 RepID=A0A937F320_9BACT|nr:RagB/SusD family nutrient uptake outer membrane protein [Fulvivirga sediminis]MBL3655401.1 RagB/SusD family nutrient uptake outer membrane protein [Fulvivirga sediminis]